MHTRRSFIFALVASLSSLALSNASECAAASSAFKGRELFDRIVGKSAKEHWNALPLGALMGKIALEFENSPYKENTLELSIDKEICCADLTAFDCVTFFETTLDFARMLKMGTATPDSLLAQIKVTRYRGGIAGDYSSRLHYMTDWLADNESRGVVKILSNLPGTEPFKKTIDFMSSHPGSYKQLAKHPELVSKIRQFENVMNTRSMMFIPINKIAAVEHLLQTGDIVAVCTDKPGIDIVHTGLVYSDANGLRHFMDASSKKSVMKVTIEPGPISQALTWSKSLSGAIFARPLEPRF